MRRNQKFTGLLMLGLMLACSFNASLMASTDDIQQPIHIEADRAEIDELRGVMTYTGRVVLRQGGIEVRADTVVVITKDGELQRITAQGQPVHYSQRQTPLHASETDVRGVSQRMEYDASSKQILLLGKAEFWQGNNRFSGHRIQYDPAAEKIIASAGNASDAALDGEAAPRVTVTIQPRSRKAASPTTIAPNSIAPIDTPQP